MIVPETLLRELFSQIPPVKDKSGKLFPVKFHWGGQDDMNLYMKQESGNKTPLIWLVQDKSDENDYKHVLERRVLLFIAKDSTHKTSRNPIVWDTEFAETLNPLLEKVKKCLKSSGFTTIIDGKSSVDRRANFSEYERDGNGRKTETKTIDHWNVIIFEANVRFEAKANGEPNCINTIKF